MEDKLDQLNPQLIEAVKNHNFLLALQLKIQIQPSNIPTEDKYIKISNEKVQLVDLSGFEGRKKSDIVEERGESDQVEERGVSDQVEERGVSNQVEERGVSDQVEEWVVSDQVEGREVLFVGEEREVLDGVKGREESDREVSHEVEERKVSDKEEWRKVLVKWISGVDGREVTDYGKKREIENSDEETTAYDFQERKKLKIEEDFEEKISRVTTQSIDDPSEEFNDVLSKHALSYYNIEWRHNCNSSILSVFS